MTQMTQQQRDELASIEGLLRARMDKAQRRLKHTLNVADTAAELARTYGVDEFLARAAGLLHDWDKVVPADELAARAVHLGLDFSAPVTSVLPLLHGPVAARELPAQFPELPEEVFQAVARHTVGAADMTPLDMVVFVADGIEPMRNGEDIARLRALVGDVSLEELFFECLAQGASYVLQTRRYLYPGTVDVYNAYVAKLGRA